MGKNICENGNLKLESMSKERRSENVFSITLREFSSHIRIITVKQDVYF